MHADEPSSEEDTIQSIIISKEDSSSSDFPHITRLLEAKFIGKKIEGLTLKELRKAARKQMEEEGMYVADVFFPPQEVADGSIHLHVTSPIISGIEIRGDLWEPSSFYKKELAPSIGERLNMPQLLNQVAWFNRHPFHYSEVVVIPDAEKETVSLDFVVKDRFALRPFVGADNTGTNLTNQIRIFGGLTWGRPFGRSDLMTYQYSTAPNGHDFYAHTGSYLIFLPWKHELTFYGGYSAVHPHLTGFTQKGQNTQASLRYAIPFKPLYKEIQQTASWGCDYKNFNSNVFFIDYSPEIPVVTQQVNLFQFYASYSWQKKLLFKAELFFSPFAWLPDQTRARYEALRADSQPQYLYGRLTLGDTYGTSNQFSCAWTLRLQGATNPLLPSEQFGLGGYDTVRGYEERDFLADNALCTNIEIRSPEMQTPFFKKDSLTFLLFSDFGAGHNYDSQQKSLTYEYLWSAGGGVRYRISPYFSVRADYGAQLHHIFGQHQAGRFHLGGSLSY